MEVAHGARRAITAAFLTIDLAFLGANLLKVMRGGWLPLGVARSCSR